MLVMDSRVKQGKSIKKDYLQAGSQSVLVAATVKKQ